MALVDRVMRQEERLHGADLLALHVSGLGLFSLLYEALQPVIPGRFAAASPRSWRSAPRRWRDGCGRGIRSAALNALALAFALAALGIAVQFDGPSRSWLGG